DLECPAADVNVAGTVLVGEGAGEGDVVQQRQRTGPGVGQAGVNQTATGQLLGTAAGEREVEGGSAEVARVRGEVAVQREIDGPGRADGAGGGETGQVGQEQAAGDGAGPKVGRLDD